MKLLYWDIIYSKNRIMFLKNFFAVHQVRKSYYVLASLINFILYDGHTLTCDKHGILF